MYMYMYTVDWEIFVVKNISSVPLTSKFLTCEIFSTSNIRTCEVFSKSNNKIVKHFSEYACKANGCVEPIGSLPDPRGDLIHVRIL